MHHITAKLHRSSTHSNGEGTKEQVAARDREKRKLMEWESQKKPLDYAQIMVDPNKKIVGHSSKVLRYDDFELIKTLGTGTCHLIGCDYARRRSIDECIISRATNQYCDRHICSSMACQTRQCKARRSQQGVCAQEVTQDGWYASRPYLSS